MGALKHLFFNGAKIVFSWLIIQLKISNFLKFILITIRFMPAPQH